MNKTAKTGVFIFFIFLLSYSLIANTFRENIRDLFFFQLGMDMDEKLAGIEPEIREASFSATTWFNGSFQESTASLSLHNITFRNWLIRIRNQVVFTCFSESTNNTIVVGKNNFLFEKRYLDSYVGNDYLGRDLINFRVYEIKQVQQKLKAMGKELLIILAPTKPKLFPEYVPYPYHSSIIRPTNYNAFIKAFKKYHLDYIDFNSWFIQLKDTSSHVLIPQTGIHWSNYAASLCADSTISFLEQLWRKKLNHFKLKNFSETKEEAFSENDLGELLNLLNPIPTPSNTKVNLEFENDTSKKKPCVLAVSDSYYWNWLKLGIPQNLFSDESQYWYYNHTAYKKNNRVVPYKELNLKAEIAKTDIVILMAVETNLNLFPFDFAKEFNAIP